MNNSFDSHKNAATELLKTIIEDMKSPKLPPSIVVDRLSTSTQKYYCALAFAGDAKSKASVYKNLVKAFELRVLTTEDAAMKLFYFNSCVNSLNKALYFGSST